MASSCLSVKVFSITHLCPRVGSNADRERQIRLLIRGYVAKPAALLMKRRSISMGSTRNESPHGQENVISRPKAGLTRRLGSETLN
jgi:hypothetical protein